MTTRRATLLIRLLRPFAAIERFVFGLWRWFRPKKPSERENFYAATLASQMRDTPAARRINKGSHL